MNVKVANHLFLHKKKKVPLNNNCQILDIVALWVLKGRGGKIWLCVEGVSKHGIWGFLKRIERDTIREIDIEKYKVLLGEVWKEQESVEDECNNFQYMEN